MRLKFLNQFYLFNGFNKFIEHQLKTKLDEKMSEAARDKLLVTLRLINSNLDKKERDVMRIFECDQTWPICLYDFTFKNRNSNFITMRATKCLKDFVVDDYIKQRGGLNKNAQYKQKIKELELVREMRQHFCTSKHNWGFLDKEKVYRFIRNFKILFIKGDPLLLKNKNLKFDID